MVRGEKLSGENIELNVQIVRLSERAVVFIPHSVIESNFWRYFPFILAVENIVLLLAEPLSRRAIIEDAWIGQISHITDARTSVGQERIEIAEGVLRSAVAIRVETNRTNLTAH